MTLTYRNTPPNSPAISHILLRQRGRGLHWRDLGDRRGGNLGVVGVHAGRGFYRFSHAEDGTLLRPTAILFATEYYTL